MPTTAPSARSPARVVTTLAGLAGVMVARTEPGALRGSVARGVSEVDLPATVYVAIPLINTIRKVTPAGVVTTIAGSPGLFGG
jgi:hypothetical protein